MNHALKSSARLLCPWLLAWTSALAGEEAELNTVQSRFTEEQLALIERSARLERPAEYLIKEPLLGREIVAEAVARRPFKRGRSNDAIGLALPLAADCLWMGDLSEGMDALQRRLSAVVDDPVQEGRIAGGLAVLHWAKGEHDIAIRQAERHAGLPYEAGYRWDLANWMRLLKGRWQELAGSHRLGLEPDGGGRSEYHLNGLLYHALIEDREAVRAMAALHHEREGRRGLGGAVWAALLIGDIEAALRLCEESERPFLAAEILHHQLRFDEAAELLNQCENRWAVAVTRYSQLIELGEAQRAAQLLDDVPLECFQGELPIRGIIEWEMKHRRAIDVVNAALKHEDQSPVRTLKEPLSYYKDQHSIYFNWMKYLPEELEEPERLRQVFAFARGELDPVEARGLADHILAQRDDPHPNFRAALHLACGDYEKAWELRLPRGVSTLMKENRWELVLKGIEILEERVKYPLRERVRYDRFLAKTQLGEVATGDEARDLMRPLLLSSDLFRYLAERRDIMQPEFEELFSIRQRLLPSHHEVVFLERQADWLASRGRHQEAAHYRAALLKVKDTPKNAWPGKTLLQVCQLHEALGFAAVAEGDLDEALRQVEWCQRLFPARTTLATAVLPLLAEAGRAPKARSVAKQLLAPLDAVLAEFPNAYHLVEARNQLAAVRGVFEPPCGTDPMRALFLVAGMALFFVGSALVLRRLPASGS